MLSGGRSSSFSSECKSVFGDDDEQHSQAKPYSSTIEVIHEPVALELDMNCLSTKTTDTDKARSPHEADRRKKYMISREEFNLDVRYVPYKKLGSGSYGIVCSAIDDNAVAGSSAKVAIKKVRDVFHSVNDAKRILREIKLLQHLKGHPNIMALRDIINPLDVSEFESLYLVMDLMQSDLHKIIRSNNVLTHDHMAYIGYQLLCGLKYMHSAHILHRDLKPGNVLVNADCELKICDLGLARGVREDSTGDVELTEYVVSRWYRAPEIMVSGTGYDYAIDVWAVGCILAELVLREPIFRGDNYVDQLMKIFGVLGTPSDEDFETISNVQALVFIHQLDKIDAMPWSAVFPEGSSSDMIDLVSKMLVFNPKKRITVDEALKHPFFSKFYSEEFINSKCVCSSVFDFEFEKSCKTKVNIQELLYHEIVKFRPHMQEDGGEMLKAIQAMKEASLSGSRTRRKNSNPSSRK